MPMNLPPMHTEFPEGSEDQTARCQLELERLRSELAQARQRQERLLQDKLKAEEASVAKSQFLANMSHDIRTPMNAILGLLRLLQSTELTARQLDYISNTESTARSLLGLINDILDFSKVEAGKMVLDPQPFRVDRLLRDLSVVLSVNVGSKPVELLFDVDPRVPLALVGDAMRLQQILVNLGGNAVKFTESGEVVVRIRVLALTAQEVSLRVSVCDTGIGIAPEHQQSIFQSFSQATTSTSRRFGGTGLGLAISRRFIQLMGGDLQLSSQVGQGSEFFFEITLPVADASRVSDGLPMPRQGRPEVLKVLLIDDNATSLRVLQELCCSLGWEVDVATGGEQALALVQHPINQSRPYQVVFVDYQMPGMDGWETARLIRQREPQPPCHLIMLTAHGRDAWAARSDAERSWLDGFLAKPVTASLVLEAVSHRHGGRAGLPPQLQKAKPKAQRLRGMRVLVVEDNLINQRIAAELLASEGVSVTLAANGKKGVQAVLDAQVPFDVVLMDLQMPVMDGFEATHALRQIHGLNDLAIVAMTANAMESDKQACLAAGMNDHVGKPFDMEQLVATLVRHAPAGFAHVAKQPHTADDQPLHALLLAAAPPCLNMQAALDRLDGEADLYVKLMGPFLHESNHMMVGLKASLAQLQMADAHRFAVGLKGIAENMGASQVAELAAELADQVNPERAAHGARPASWLPVEELEQALLAVHNALHGLLRATRQPQSVGGGATTNAAELERARLRAELERFVAMLRNADLTALGIYQHLRAHHAQSLQPFARGLADSINKLDFAHAADLCDALLAQLPAAPSAQP